MPVELFAPHARVPEGQDAFFMLRILTADGTNLVTGDLRSASDAVFSTNLYARVFDMDDADPDAAVYTDTIAYSARATYVFDTLKTDDYWGGIDGTGYNFRYQLVWTNAGGTGFSESASYTPRAGHRYRIEFQINLNKSGALFGLIYPQATFELVPRSTL